ncbi:hypothetical protein ACHAXM_000033, partial [Skeletonema potamos]
MASASPTNKSPLPVVAQSPIFSPAADAFSNNRRVKADKTVLLSRTSSTCTDTPNLEDSDGDGCDWYEKHDEPGCPEYGDEYEGASVHCCYCSNPSCEDYKSRCQVSSNDLAWNKTANTCEEAADCFCSNTDSVKYVPSPFYPGHTETVGLYNECKCNYWLRRCEDTRKETTCLNAVL